MEAKVLGNVKGGILKWLKSDLLSKCWQIAQDTITLATLGKLKKGESSN